MMVNVLDDMFTASMKFVEEALCTGCPKLRPENLRNFAVAQWDTPHGTTLRLCKACLDACLDAADNFPLAEPTKLTFLCKVA
ncbi:hypothetical protein [Prauserella endophytica]|uniref:Ferredoxin n=1 Tax=Prauserella endophytica TaxID=1592324 RepID=A0ABY2RST7_9PSEU|nr:hypothetical protein [Prauserella endophytica]TKG58886.1 hypothetical protein FCN18_37355 [Prauserella endophytica]